MSTTLYDTDFNAWTLDQAARLRQAGGSGAKASGLDWDNIAEEIESMARSERSEIENRLTQLLFHLAKLAWCADQPPRRGWKVTVNEQRRGLQRVLTASPSLRHHPATILADCWATARDRTEADLNLPENTLPETCPWSLDDQVLNQAWLPPSP
ncbi:DUF29 domain-containing protein [uncultured Gammaproteobacteria bacterium]